MNFLELSEVFANHVMISILNFRCRDSLLKGSGYNQTLAHHLCV